MLSDIAKDVAKENNFFILFQLTNIFACCE